MKIVFTGAAGFIAGCSIKELLKNGHETFGIRNYSKNNTSVEVIPWVKERIKHGNI